ncbi:MAG TPA: glutaredoxin family protein [Pseudomonadota bacterium]|nr:glutaredoxin family protein [Pseudomonadota bacterium]
MTVLKTRAASALALLALFVAVAATAQTQQVYRYVDPDGRVVYSDKPPPPNARDAQAKRVGQNTIETSDLSYSEVMAQERFPVTLYTFGCGTICDTASALLNKRGIPHTVVDVGQGDGADKLKRLTGGLDAPALQVGDQYATGFNESRWQTLLDDAGYPKTPPPRTAPVGKAPAPASEPAPTTQTVTPPASGGYPQ